MESRLRLAGACFVALEAAGFIQESAKKITSSSFCG
jgi:hypothetical protein